MSAHPKVSTLRTPSALIDLARVEQNTSRMARRIEALGARLRPHVKTHKCVEAARLQVSGHFDGITVSTMAEATAFALAGFDDITWALPLPLSRMAEALDLTRRVRRLNLLLDDEATLASLEEAASARGVRVSAFLKVDCGNHRAGVDPRSDRAVRLATSMARSAWVDFRGVLAHAGQAYACRSVEEIEAVATEERQVTAAFADRLRASGLEVPEVSIGSTPTMCVARDLTGITEVRPGNYVFFDAFQLAIGSCTLEDVAMTVLTTVIGRYPSRDTLVIDAGALALSKDEGARHVDAQCGYGLVLSEDGLRVFDELRVVSLSQEHGLLQVRGGLSEGGAHPVGERLRIVPNHSCLSAALFGQYSVISSDRVVATWRPVRGWE